MHHYFEFPVMGLGLTDQQRLDNYRKRYEITHDRIRELASYNRITDAAIWGFIGITFIEFFKEIKNANPLLSLKIPIFLLILIISMHVWRKTVGKYQVQILEEYKAIREFEEKLQIDDDHSMTQRQARDMAKRGLIMSDGIFVDHEHEKLDKLAKNVKWIALIALIVWIVAWIVLKYQIWLYIIPNP